MAAKKAVQCGNVEDAIEKVNDFNPEVSSKTITILISFLKLLVLWLIHRCVFDFHAKLPPFY